MFGTFSGIVLQCKNDISVKFDCYVASESDLEDVILIVFMIFELFGCVFIENMVENIVVGDLVTAKSIGAKNKYGVAIFENKTR